MPPHGLVEFVVGMSVLAVARHFGFGGTMPIWVDLIALTVSTLLFNEAIQRRLAGGVPGGRLNRRLALTSTSCTITAYLIGWGPLLIPVAILEYAVFQRADRAVPWALAGAYTLALTLVGQIAIATGVVDSHVNGAQGHVQALFMCALSVLIVRQLGICATERDRAERQVTLNERRFRTLVEESADVITVADHAGVLTYVSPSSDRVLGIPTGTLLGSHAFDWVHPDDKHIAGACLAQVTSLAAEEQLDIEVRIRHGDGTWYWHHVVVRNFLDDPAIVGIVSNHRDISERRRWQERLEFEATHDGLTGLPNRLLYIERLTIALSRATAECAVGALFVDLNGFKQVNDTLGHDAGDELLVSVAHRMREAVRSGDTVARLGGDEFTVLMPDVADPSVVLAVAERLHASLAAPFVTGECSAQIGASIGIVITHQPDDPDTIIRRADRAMYRAKHSSTGYELCNDALDSQ